MSQTAPNQAARDAAAAAPWRDLYRVGAVSAIVSELVILLGFVDYFLWPYAPGNLTTESIFKLLQSNPLGGLISLDLFLVVGNLFGIILFLALYAALKTVNPSYALIALALGLIAAVLIIPARPLFELVNLSALYAGAATTAAKSQYLAAGEALLATFNGMAWFMNTLLGGASLVISSLLMLNSKVFSKATAYVGLATNIVVCLFFIPGAIGKLMLFLSLPGYLVWYFQLARRFLQLAHPGLREVA